MLATGARRFSFAQDDGALVPLDVVVDVLPHLVLARSHHPSRANDLADEEVELRVIPLVTARLGGLAQQRLDRRWIAGGEDVVHREVAVRLAEVALVRRVDDEEQQRPILASEERGAIENRLLELSGRVDEVDVEAGPDRQLGDLGVVAVVVHRRRVVSGDDCRRCREQCADRVGQRGRVGGAGRLPGDADGVDLAGRGSGIVDGVLMVGRRLHPRAQDVVGRRECPLLDGHRLRRREGVGGPRPDGARRRLECPGGR